MKPSSLIPRRHFLRSSLLVAGALHLPRSRGAAAATGAARNITIGLSQYSLRQLFRENVLDPMDYPAFARDTFGLTQLDLWEGGLPRDRLDDHDYLRSLRQRAVDAGAHLFLLMTGALDATPNTPGERRARAADHFPAIDRAVSLGCLYLRVFVRAPQGDREAALQACVDGLRSLSDRAAERGVILAIEPGASDHTKDGVFLADLMRRLRHANCRLMPDFGKMSGDIYEGTKAMMPYTVVVSAKTHEFDAAGNQVEFDYPRLMRIVVQAGFTGIVAIEWEGKLLDPIEGVRASKRLIERSLGLVA